MTPLFIASISFPQSAVEGVSDDLKRFSVFHFTILNWYHRSSRFIHTFVNDREILPRSGIKSKATKILVILHIYSLSNNYQTVRRDVSE